MTDRQRHLARHALGLPNKLKTSYRNRFVAGDDHQDYGDWIKMVADGNAAQRLGTSLPYGGDSLFWLTEEGAKKALTVGEKLDREDFKVDR